MEKRGKKGFHDVVDQCSELRGASANKPGNNNNKTAYHKKSNFLSSNLDFWVKVMIEELFLIFGKGDKIKNAKCWGRNRKSTETTFTGITFTITTNRVATQLISIVDLRIFVLSVILWTSSKKRKERRANENTSMTAEEAKIGRPDEAIAIVSSGTKYRVERRKVLQKLETWQGYSQ